MKIFIPILSLALLAFGSLQAAEKPDIANIYTNPLSNGFGDDIAWVKWEDAIETALEINKPIFLLIHKTWCHACKSLKKSMQQSNARKAFKALSEYFVMVNTVDDEEPFEEEYRPDGKYIPRLLFLDKNGDLLPDIKNKKAEYKNYSYYYSSPADILNSMKDVLRYFDIEVPSLKKGESLKAKKPEKKRIHADGPEPPQKEKKEKDEKETKEEKPEETKPERVEPKKDSKKDSKKEESKKDSKKEEPKESKKGSKKSKSEL